MHDICTSPLGQCHSWSYIAGVFIASLYEWSALIILPQSVHEFCDHDTVRVEPDQPQDKHPVLSQVVLREVGRQLLVAVAVEFLHHAQVFLDVADAIAADGELEQPCGDVGRGEHRQHHHPEPDEDVDLLVEQIDGEDTLHRVAMVVAQATRREVAHGDAGKLRRHGPVLLTGHQVADHRESVHVIIRAQERVQHEELAQHVDDVEDLGDQVEDDQIVAVSAAEDEAARARHEVLDAHDAPLLTLTPAADVPVELTRHVPHALLARLGEVRVLKRHSRLDDVVDVDSGFTVQRAPQQTRQVEH